MNKDKELKEKIMKFLMEWYQEKIENRLESLDLMIKSGQKTRINHAKRLLFIEGWALESYKQKQILPFKVEDSRCPNREACGIDKPKLRKIETKHADLDDYTGNMNWITVYLVLGSGIVDNSPTEYEKATETCLKMNIPFCQSCSQEKTCLILKIRKEKQKDKVDEETTTTTTFAKINLNDLIMVPNTNGTIAQYHNPYDIKEIETLEETVVHIQKERVKQLEEIERLKTRVDNKCQRIEERDETIKQFKERDLYCQDDCDEIERLKSKLLKLNKLFKSCWGANSRCESCPDRVELKEKIIDRVKEKIKHHHFADFEPEDWEELEGFLEGKQ